MRIEQLQRYMRYLKSYTKHLTLKKLINAIKIEWARHFNHVDVSKLSPYFLVCDLAVSCNLQCPLCQTGQRRNIKREKRMTLENYQKVIAPLKEYLFAVNLYNWSEPFLNKEIYEIISYNTQNNISSYISSNLNLPIEAERLVQSGLNHLVVSADGIEQEVYEKYRVGGKIDKVIENIKAIVAAKKRLGSKYPTIEWQCLVNRYNESSINETEKFAKSIGVDEVRFANLNLFSSTNPEEDSKKWLPKLSKFRFFNTDNNNKKRTRKPCFWLWRSVVVAGDGDALPCCLYDIRGWGNAINSDILSIWREGKFKQGRALSLPSGEQSNEKTICNSCTAPFIFK